MTSQHSDFTSWVPQREATNRTWRALVKRFQFSEGCKDKGNVMSKVTMYVSEDILNHRDEDSSPELVVVIMFHTEKLQLFSVSHRGWQRAALLLPADSADSFRRRIERLHLQFGNNNVIWEWAELLNPLWDFSLLSASVITDHSQEEEKRVLPPSHASIFILISSVCWELFSIGLENCHSLYQSPLLLSSLCCVALFQSPRA